MNNLAYAITKSLGHVENGGKPNVKNPVKGKTGEMKSIFQYTPDTWRQYSKQVFGKEAPLTPDNEVHVTQAKVEEWLKNGLTPQQIFSSWNAGPGEPNAYTGKFSNGHSSIGVNPKYGVKYDVPRYVSKAMSYLDRFSKETPSQLAQPPQNQLRVINTPKTTPTQMAGKGNIKGLINSLLPPTT